MRKKGEKNTLDSIMESKASTEILCSNAQS